MLVKLNLMLGKNYNFNTKPLCTKSCKGAFVMVRKLWLKLDSNYTAAKSQRKAHTFEL